MVTPAISQQRYMILPVLRLTPDRVQEYWQTLHVHDTLKYRLADTIDPTWTDVLGMIQRCGKQMYMVADNGSTTEDPKLIGEFMLECFTGKSAQIHFSFHPDLPTPDKLDVGRFTLDSLLRTWKRQDAAGEAILNEPYLDSVYGLTPVTNRVACIFALKAGFKKLGILPGGIRSQGKIVDAQISVASRG